jgi:hypothetical protein
MRRTARFTDALSAHRKGLVLAGSTAALLGVGAGTASAATVAPASHVSAESAGSTAAAFRKASTADVALLTAALEKGPASLVKPASHVAAHRVHSLKPAASRVAARDVAAKPAAPKVVTWAQAAEIQAHRNDPKLAGTSLPAADQLRPVAVFGQQETMQLSPAQVANATTIVKQALAKNMGVRSAVIAVATSMQESELMNINYGTSDSLGLFQQRPSCGWGTAQQILNPAYAADAFLGALKTYQASDPTWANQPLWQVAQGVQASGFPTAYAKWEAQAAGLVQGITTHLTK